MLLESEVKELPYEGSGRSDKRGNRFEIRVVIYYLLKVIEEKIEYIVLEALGDDEQGVDIWIGHKDGKKEGQQCKGRNGSKAYWDFGTANAKGIFTNWKFQLDRDPTHIVSLTSPLAFSMLEDLADRSRNTSDSPNDFYHSQVLLSSKEFIAFFNNTCNAFCLNPKEAQDLERCIDYFNRIYYRQFPDAQLKEIILDKINYLFLGDAKAIYDRFIGLIVDGNILGKKITSAYINDFLHENDLRLKNLSFDERVIPRLNELNQEYREAFLPLAQGLFNRDEFIICREALESEQSLIIHGKAGRGKSGCAEDIINYCEEINIQYVAIKLDKRIPSGNAEKWGKELGLPTSIVHCIHSVTKDDKAVIILDQLDALRWTQAHSRDSLLVCSEIIKQVSRLNAEREHNISIVFVCRTYDLENDNNISFLFKNSEQDKDSLQWNKIQIGELNDNQVQDIVGKVYDNLTKKLKELLKSPSNIYIWQHLELYNGIYECSTTSHLVLKWWEQLVRGFVELGFAENDIQQTKEKIVEQFDKLGRLSIPINILNASKTAMDFLDSNGFFVIQGSKISFAHQSVLDYFLAKKMLNQYYSEVDMEEIVGNREKQTPGRRYQLQMLMQSIIEIDSQDFINAGLRMLNSESIRYYNKYVFFEVLNQIENVDDVVGRFIIEYCEDATWGSHLINNVIQSKLQYFRILRDSGLIDKWFNNPDRKDIALNLLVSIRPNYEVRDIELIEKFAFNSEEEARRFSHCFLQDINKDTYEMFELRMRLYFAFPMLADSYIDFKSMLKNFELRAIRYLASLLENKIKNKEKNIYRYEMEFLYEDSELLIENGLEVIKLLLPYVPLESSEVSAFSDWSAKYHRETIERVCINILKKTNGAIISINPKTFLYYYEYYMGKGNDIFNELILDALYRFPEDLSDFVVSYMCDDFERDIIDRTSGNTDRLHLAKLVLEKHSKYCSQFIFDKLENRIIYYTSTEAVDTYRRRIEFNKGNNEVLVYWSFWGELQYELLRVLPFARLSQKAMSLIQVLERKFINVKTQYVRDYSIHSGWVKSPVSDKNLKARNWLGIITNKKLKNRGHRNWTKVSGGFIESTLEEFSRSFCDAVSKEPENMIDLVLSSKKNIEETFIDSLFSGVAYSKFLNSVPSKLIEKIILQYPCDFVSYRARSVCTIIEKSEYVEWSQEILDVIKEIAVNHKNPEEDNPIVISQNDDKMESYEMLLSNAINCVRGSAAQAIGHILWTKVDCFIQFKDTIEQLSADINPAVRLSSFFAIWPSYNINKEWASEKILSLYEQDHRLAGFYDTRDMLFLLYNQYRERVLEIIKKCYFSDDEELVKKGAHCLAEMYILKDEFNAEMSNFNEMSKVQAEEVLFMVMLYFNKCEYNSLAKDIISRFKSSSLDLEMPISRLFFDNLIELDRDKDFLIDIMSLNISRGTLHAFINYLEEESKSLIDFRDIIISMSRHLIDNIVNSEDREYGIDDSLSKLVIGLYDETSNSTQLQLKGISSSCLDLWDKMFEYQIGSSRRLSQEMMER